jgi:hypothetical protein
MQFLLLLTESGKMIQLQGIGTILVVFCGPVLLAFDLIKGSSRILLSLPLQRGTIVKTLWIISIGIPGLLSLFMALCSFLVYRPSDGNYTYLLLRPWFVFSICGLLFMLLTASPPGHQRGFWRNAFSCLAGAAWGGSMGGAMLIMPTKSITWNELQTQHWMLLILGTLAAIAGGWTSEYVLVNRATSRASHGSSSAKPMQLTPKTGGLGGWMHLWWMQVSQVFLFGAGAAVVILAIDWFYSTGRESAHSAVRILPIQIGFLASILFSMRWALCMRTFRLAPITSDNLSLLLTALSVMPGLAFALLIGAVHVALESKASMLDLVVVGLIMAGISSATLPLSLSLVKSRPTAIPVLVTCVFVFTLSLPVSETIALYTVVPVVVAGTICVGLVLASVISLRRMLRNNSECYQPRIIAFSQTW